MGGELYATYNRPSTLLRQRIAAEKSLFDLPAYLGLKGDSAQDHILIGSELSYLRLAVKARALACNVGSVLLGALGVSSGSLCQEGLSWLGKALQVRAWGENELPLCLPPLDMWAGNSYLSLSGSSPCPFTRNHLADNIMLNILNEPLHDT